MPAQPPTLLLGKHAAIRRVNVYIDGYNLYIPLSAKIERAYELSCFAACYPESGAISKSWPIQLSAGSQSHEGSVFLPLAALTGVITPDNFMQFQTRSFQLDSITARRDSGR